MSHLCGILSKKMLFLYCLYLFPNLNAKTYRYEYANFLIWYLWTVALKIYETYTRAEYPLVYLWGEYLYVYKLCKKRGSFSRAGGGGIEGSFLRSSTLPATFLSLTLADKSLLSSLSCSVGCLSRKANHFQQTNFLQPQDWWKQLQRRLRGGEGGGKTKGARGWGMGKKWCLLLTVY